MTQVNNIRKPDYAGALTTAAAGGAVWSACEYFFKKHPYINDNKILKDTFVKQMEESLQAINDAKTIETINFQKGLEAEIDAIKNSGEIKAFFERKKDLLTDIPEKAYTDIDEILKANVSEKEVNNIKAEMKTIFKQKGPYRKYFQETIDACLDKSEKLVHNTEKMSAEKFGAIKKAINKFRLNSALISGLSFAAISAVIMCGFEFFLGKKKS